MQIFVNLITRAIFMSTPLVLGALGEVLAERTGMMVTAIEGIFLVGAWGGFIGAYLSGNLLIGFLLAMVCGLIVALLYGVTTIYMHQHQIVMGTAVAILVTGCCTFFYRVIFGIQTVPLKVSILKTIKIPLLSKIPIIEKDKNRCEELSDMLPEAMIICGDGTDRSLLLEEGLATAESFVTLTNMDEENIFLSLSAKKLTEAKLVAKVNRLPYKDVIDDLDLGSVIYPKYITSDSILRYVRAMQNTIGSNVETLYHILDNQAEALEFNIRDNSPVVGIPLAELNLKSNLLVCCLARKGTVRIPRGQDTIQVGDNVVIVTTNKGLRDIRDILA